jgi:hypothetical protein
MSMLLRRALFIAAIVASSSARIAKGQSNTTLTSGALAVEERSSERWMHGRQLARFTRFTSLVWPQTVFFIDSMQDGGTRHLFITLDRTSKGRDSAVVIADSLGHVTEMQVGFVGERHSVSDDELRMPEARLWELVPSAPPGTPRVGLAWTDTIAHEAVDGPFRLGLHGTRQHHCRRHDCRRAVPSGQSGGSVGAAAARRRVIRPARDERNLRRRRRAATARRSDAIPADPPTLRLADHRVRIAR